MRLTLTVVDPALGERADVVLDGDDETPLAAVAEELAGVLGRAVRSGEQAAVLRFPTGGGRAERAAVASGVSMYVDGALLDPDLTLHESPLREGTLVSLDDPSGCLLPEPTGLVEIRVVGGPGAGVVHRLGAGEHDIGGAHDAAVPLEGTDLPDRALVVLVGVDGTARVRAYDGVAAQLDREDLLEEREWRPDVQATLGDVLLELHHPTPADAALEPSSDGTALDYNRPPRLLPPLRKTRFRLPTVPSESERRPIPILMAVLPLIMSVVMVLIFKRIYMLLFGLLAPISLIGNYFYEKRSGRKSHRRKMVEYRETKAAIEADASEALLEERSARREAFPDPAALLLTAVGPRRRLWERRRHDADALTIRVGTGDLDSEVVLDDPDQLEHRREQTWTALDVPVTVPLRERGVLGIAGRDDFPRAVARWAVAQSAVLHSPGDLRLYVLTDAQARESWEWVRWLPHARPQDGQDALTLLGCDADSIARRVGELVALVSARRAVSSPGQVLDEPDVVMVLDGARRLRSLPGMVGLLRDGPAVGVYAICLDADERLLPEECQAVVVQEATGVRVQQMRIDVTRDVRPDVVSAAWCDRVARSVAALHDVSGDSEESALPSSSRLLDVLGLEPPTHDAIAARWTVGGRTTEALIGDAMDGPFALDLRRDGPHALVAGTTGAGKSELLQSLVASLAVANRPDAMTFVLVDYKGGAAFADCERLPHTVGMVTDLDTHLVERALESLGAELRRREHQLAGAGAKDIDDYVDLLVRDPSMEPMPRLVIVIDEFASMVRELPDFVTGMVNIAQRGRSLGIHLILATQRPTGVVSPEIRANTNLRLALRMTDGSESSDVIDAPDAGRIAKTTPGRAYARLGHSSLVAFQTGRIGGRRPGTASRDALRPWVTGAQWPVLGKPVPVRPRPPAVADEEVTDLQVLVAEICGAAERLGLPAQHSPWLPALPESTLLDDLELPATVGGHEAAVPVAAYALEDVPAQQARRTAVIDLARFSHLYVVGAPRSGRSQTLRTIAGSLASRTSSADVHLYGIDCGNGALLPLAGLPHCGAVVSRTQTERATRLILRLAGEVRRRQELLAEGGYADVSEQRAAVLPEERLAHLVVLLDRWEGFVSTLGEVDGGRLTEEVYALLREGASVGIHLVIAGDRTLVSGRISTLTDDKLALRLTDKADFGLANINPRSVPDELAPGRAFRADSGTETQIALLAADATAAGQAAALARIAADAKERDADVPRGRRPFRVDVLPARLSFADAWDLRIDDVVRPMWGLVGVGGDDLQAWGPELREGARSFVIGGPPKSGRSTTLVTMARSFIAGGASVVLAAPRSSPLRELAGTEGVLAVFTGSDVAADELTAALDAAPGPVVVLMDDAELLRDAGAADVLRSVMRSGDERAQGLVLAGSTDDICTGFSGWQVEAKKSRAGALLSPQGNGDGDLIGVRLPRSVVGGQVVPGRALVHLGDTALHTVQVPLTAP